MGEWRPYRLLWTVIEVMINYSCSRESDGAVKETRV
jgi:hypothetical protein